MILPMNETSADSDPTNKSPSWYSGVIACNIKVLTLFSHSTLLGWGVKVTYCSLISVNMFMFNKAHTHHSLLSKQLT